jgi:hypothetical protein
MIKVSASVCIDAPAAKVWERLARLEDIQHRTLWQITYLEIAHRFSSGVLPDLSGRGIGDQAQPGIFIALPS